MGMNTARINNGQLRCGAPGCDDQLTNVFEGGYYANRWPEVEGDTLILHFSGYDGDGDDEQLSYCAEGHLNVLDLNEIEVEWA